MRILKIFSNLGKFYQSKPIQQFIYHDGAIQNKDEALIGRVEGPYAPKLGRLQFVSARHARLTREGDHWIIADVGSRNGTAVNGEWCFSPLPFKTGDVVRIANFYDFIAE
ncbi:MAG: FHA domain-containing protein [Muribaculaceae bacterium]|nr:FHA domain-containing protein [Muribaculaceae bacterium]